jgi:hypothetical protein
VDVGEIVTVAVKTWFPFASVPSVGVTGPGTDELPENWNVPVIDGLFVELVAVTVMVTDCPKLILEELGVSATVVE